jgi:oligoribonuclease (3'-5' exoribonuclease)
MVVLCQLKDLGLSCFGCCGNSYGSRKKLHNDIKKNTLEFNSKKSITHFMSRTKDLRSSGICANLIYTDKTFYCPGHPALHSGRDYRNLDPDCEKDFLCKTFGLFQQWPKQRQNQFLEFLKEKVSNGMASFDYSIKMDDGSLLEEFGKK